MTYAEQAFPAARVKHWSCPTQTDRLTSTVSVTSVCYFQVPPTPTLGGFRQVLAGVKADA